jgi:hypothetical protein
MGRKLGFPIYKDLRLNAGSTYMDSKVVVGIGILWFPTLSKTWRLFSRVSCPL